MTEEDSIVCGCPADEECATRDLGWRALWIGNLGYGVAEIVGGFLANSQALKADALDFLGDGSIRSLVWTRSARRSRRVHVWP